MTKGTISEKQRRGSVGESQVDARLSSFCQVLRPKELHDVGLDFFCRLLENDKLSNQYFWVQAKATKTLYKTWKLSISRDTIAFWLSQTFPVYVMVYEETTDTCYWLSVEGERAVWEQKLGTHQKSISIKVDKRRELKKETYSKFINQIERDTVHVNKAKGIPLFLSKGYTGIIPLVILTDVERTRFYQTVRLGLDYLIYDSWLKDDLQQAYALSKLLASFDVGHYDHFLGLARLCVQLGLISEANEAYDKAIQICRSDPNWNRLKASDTPTIEELIQQIQEEKERSNRTNSGTY